MWTLARVSRRAGPLLSVAVSLFCIDPVAAQQEPLQPGEAYVTRFAGTVPGAGGAPVLNPQGTVGGIIDLRAPGHRPSGQHWIDEPQRSPVTAGQVGQVFGVALDDASPPNVYLAATSAFGLHRTPDNAQWMPGMWGPGGPGAIYRLDAATGYAPRLFAQVTLNGRPNSGPALGNIAYDRIHKQFFVSDLETGMIHRLSGEGMPLDVYDHGTQGRANFFDAETGRPHSLPPIAFNPASQARIADCPSQFQLTPHCWNFAASGRRVWGLAVRHDPMRNETRLYYSVWSSPAFGQAQWNQAAEDDKRNSVWSVRLAAGGGFDAASTRREFLVPDFFVNPADIARAGHSQPVSDLAFAECGERPVMLVAERGGIRNLGLAEQNPFAHPHEARTLRYELDRGGSWRPVGRYDIGFYDRRKEGQPFMRANCSGGAAFGPGYNPDTWTADLSKPDQFVWLTGHALCSPEGPCNLPGFEPVVPQASAPAATPAAAQPGEPPAAEEAFQPDDSEVHGLQGMAESAFEEVAPASAFAAYPSEGEASFAAGPNQAYLIDTDINVDASGGLIEEELARNDASKIGDVAIYQLCAPRSSYAEGVFFAPPVFGAPPPFVVGHPTDLSHARVASHGVAWSHYRFGSHSLYWSHNRFGSHSRYWSHNRIGSHHRVWSHNRYRSHSRSLSHTRAASHTRTVSHWRVASHDLRRSHQRFGSHNPAVSHARTGSHNRRLSHQRLGSHDLALSHARLGSHSQALSHSRIGSHTTALSHQRAGSHSLAVSHNRYGSHSRERSHAASGSHSRQASHLRAGSIPTKPPGIVGPAVTPGHTRAASLRKPPPQELKPVVKPPPKVKPTPRVQPPPKAKPTPRVQPPPKAKPTTRVQPPPKVKPTPRVQGPPKVKPTPRVQQQQRSKKTPGGQQRFRTQQAPEN